MGCKVERLEMLISALAMYLAWPFFPMCCARVEGMSAILMHVGEWNGAEMPAALQEETDGSHWQGAGQQCSSVVRPDKDVIGSVGSVCVLPVPIQA